MVKALPFIYQPDQVARKASDVLAADWRYQTHVKNYDIFDVCCNGFFKAENPCIIIRKIENNKWCA